MGGSLMVSMETTAVTISLWRSPSDTTKLTSRDGSDDGSSAMLIYPMVERTVKNCWWVEGPVRTSAVALEMGERRILESSGMVKLRASRPLSTAFSRLMLRDSTSEFKSTSLRKGSFPTSWTPGPCSVKVVAKLTCCPSSSERSRTGGLSFRRATDTAMATGGLMKRPSDTDTCRVRGPGTGSALMLEKARVCNS